VVQFSKYELINIWVIDINVNVKCIEMKINERITRRYNIIKDIDTCISVLL